MKQRDSLPMLVSGTVMVAVLFTLLVERGWLICVPVLPALAVVYALWRKIG